MKNNESIEFETIKSNKNRLYFLCGFVCVVVLLTIFIIGRSHAKYRTTQSIPLVNGTINYTLPDLNVVAITVDGESTDTLPDGNYELLDSSYCTYKDGSTIDNLTLNYDSTTKAFSITPYTTKGTKCYLYFNEKASGSEYIFASANSPTNTTTDWTGKISYYYTGNPNNWVQFAGFWWRIIRINGDGSIRMIYQGTSANTTGIGTQIGTSAFNSSTNDNMYMGYMYQSGQVHGLGINSTIKEVLDNWYSTYIEHYGRYIDGNAGFCGDRTPSTSSSSSNGSGGTGTTTTYYGAYIRLISNNNPSLQCDSQDVYTTTDSSSGNKSLQYPIGLVTADEVILAGGSTSSGNSNYYLYTNTNYWTMSPSYFGDNYAFMFFVSSSGNLPFTGVRASNWSVRPVINLRSDIALSGSGTTLDPFKVVGA